MGVIITKFRRKKSTEELLEALDAEIRSIEARRKDTEQSQRRIVGGFLLTSVVVYLGTALLFYFYFFPATIYERIWYIIPLLLAPVMIALLKKGLTFFYGRRITRTAAKLRRLADEKRRVLERVMDTETYKVARGILERYAPEQIRRGGTVPMELAVVATPPKPVPAREEQASQQQVVRRRPMPPAVYQTPRSCFGDTAAGVAGGGVFPMVATPRTVLPRDRSAFDRVVEYLVGDGPSNRYALICRRCSGHNGMALREEFEYVSFKCCYCFAFNAARKRRPAAPRLEAPPISPPPPPPPDDTSGSERNSATESEHEDREETPGGAPPPQRADSDPAEAETEPDESGWRTEETEDSAPPAPSDS